MKQPLNEQFRRMQKLAGLITENISEDPTQDTEAVKIAEYTAGAFADYIDPTSVKFTYGPNEEGSYHLEFQLKFDGLDGHTTDEFEEELQQQIGGSSSGGPGQAFSRTFVSYEGEENGNYVFGVHRQGGYDI